MHISRSGSSLPSLGITIGDPAGVGPEVTLKALARLAKGFPAGIVLIGDEAALEPLGGLRHVCCRIIFHNLGFLKKRPVWGKMDPLYGQASLAYIDKAIEFFRKGSIDGLVTAPVSKLAISQRHPGWKGHTRYLGEAFGVRDETAMMLLAADLRFLLVTEHVDIQQVSKDITYDAVYALISRADKYLRLYFRIRRPRIGVLALNPHAGEGGLLGREEKEVISPAVQQAKKRGITAEGPGPADSMIAKAALGAYDILVAMYHDQALIPLKLIVPFKGVNLTVGLPFIRTSPLHGTAFDIAGKDKADPRSMYEAIALTVRIWQGLASCSAGRAVRTRE